MSKGIGIVIVIAVVIIGTIMWATGVYNNFVALEENVTQSWSQVENQYQRRADLIPNLVNTVKGVADFEKGTFTAVAEARAKVNQINMSADMLSDPNALQKFQSAQDGLGSALSRLLVTVERYPQLKANENFSQLQVQLEGTENRISVERRKFNQVVQGYNTSIRQVPKSIIANFSGFLQKQYFKAVAGSETAPKVEF